MRKFTKEITALLASAAVGAAVYAGTVSASSEQMEQTAGVLAAPDEIVEVTDDLIEPTPKPTLPPTAGVPLLTDDFIEPPTEPTMPPLAGDIVLPDDFIEPTPEPTDLPPLAGEPMLPDELIESTTEEMLPPLAGDVAPADGDINGDGSFDVADVVLLQKWLLGDPDTDIVYWWDADLNYDGSLDVFDLVMMKRLLLAK